MVQPRHARLRGRLSRLGWALAVAVAGAAYLAWRLSTLTGTGPLGTAFLIVEVISYLTLLGTILLVGRAERRRPAVPGRYDGSLDVFVTVCGEPLEMVADTLRSALAIQPAHRTYLLNDGRMAGRADWAAYDELASGCGVPCFTRTDGPPGKAGNLNHAFARTNGDVVLTVDADHRVVRTAGEITLGYLADPAVGFVCTRQLFDRPPDDPLYNDETFFYAVLQPAKDADNSAISCGNGTLYRRTALASVGGFSEWNLVEDLHTSYRLHAAGWRSVYCDRPVTRGTAPATPGVYLRQRLRWATDSSRLLLFDNPLRRRGLTGWQRAHYLHTVSYYSFASLQLLFLAGPPLYVLFRVPVMDAPSVPVYLAHALPYGVSVAGYLSAHVGARNAWRGVRSATFCGPVYLLSVLRAGTGRRPPSGATDKGGGQGWYSPLLLPSLLIVAVLAATLAAGLGDTRPDRSVVATWWSAVLLAVLATPLLAGTGDLRLRNRAALAVGGLASAGCLAATALAVAVPRDDGCPPARGPVTASTAATASTAVTGVSAGGLGALRLLPPARGAYLGSLAADLAGCQGAMATRGAAYGEPLAIAGWFQQWADDHVGFRADWAQAVSSAGAVPMVTWEPWRKPPGRYRGPDQPAFRLDRLAAGGYDDYVAGFARAVRAYGGAVVLRPMQEMNGTWYPWSVVANGNTPGDFVAAWRHLHEVFAAVGATNVTWVWTVNAVRGLSLAQRDLAAFYPGDSYVDWVAMTGFNWGPSDPRLGWLDVSAVVDETYGLLERFPKPIMIAEIGTVTHGGDAPAWVTDTMSSLAAGRYPRIAAVVWFDRFYRANQDFRLRGPTLAALRAAVQATDHWRAPVLSAPGRGSDGIEPPVVAADVHDAVPDGG